MYIQFVIHVGTSAVEHTPKKDVKIFPHPEKICKIFARALKMMLKIFPVSCIPVQIFKDFFAS